MKNAIAKALTMMRVSGLADYGRYPKDEDGFALMRTAYMTACLDRPGVTAKEVELAAAKCSSRMKDFPSAAEFADVCADVFASTHEMVGVELTDGRTKLFHIPSGLSESNRRLAIERECVKRGVTPPAPELPSPVVSPEMRAECIARIEGLSKGLPKVEALRPADEPREEPDSSTDHERAKQLASLRATPAPRMGQDAKDEAA